MCSGASRFTIHRFTYSHFFSLKFNLLKTVNPKTKQAKVSKTLNLFNSKDETRNKKINLLDHYYYQNQPQNHTISPAEIMSLLTILSVLVHSNYLQNIWVWWTNLLPLMHPYFIYFDEKIYTKSCHSLKNWVWFQRVCCECEWSHGMSLSISKTNSLFSCCF